MLLVHWTGQDHTDYKICWTPQISTIPSGQAQKFLELFQARILELWENDSLQKQSVFLIYLIQKKDPHVEMGQRFFEKRFLVTLEKWLGWGVGAKKSCKAKRLLEKSSCIRHI